MNKFHWLESKQLDRVTNYSTEVEPIKYAFVNNIKAFYYCTFARKKKYFGLEGRIIYLGFFKHKILKAIEFQIRVVFKAISIALKEKNSVIMVNQNLIKHMQPAVFINKLFKRKNKFITDIRTTPTNPEKFEPDMMDFHVQFKTSVKCFDGFSFITPFMEKYIMSNYNLTHYKSVNWSSGVDVNLFNPEKFQSNKNTKAFQLFYHGGISISRGNLDLIKAVKLLKDEGYAVELLQVGICVDNEIKDYIIHNKLEEWCKLLPPVALSEIPSLIAQCDLPILPFPNFMAWRVSSPIKLMEYLAMCKKVMAPNMEAFTDVFGMNSELVFYFDTNHPNPVDAIAEKLKSILDEKVLCNGNYFPEAREFVSLNYTWEKQSEQLFSFCKAL